MVDYLIFLAILTSTFSLLALGLNLQWGFTGLINFGHVGFMTLGAYVTVLLSLKGVHLLIAILVGASIAALLGLIIGLSTLRLRTDYLAIVTIGLGEVIRLIINNQELPVGDNWISGVFGVQNYPIPLVIIQPNIFLRILMIGLLTFLGIVTIFALYIWVSSAKKQLKTFIGKYSIYQQEFVSRLIISSFLGLLLLAVYISGVISLYNYTPKAGLLLLCLLVLAFVFWRLEVVLQSPWGRVLKAIREDEEVAIALGKNVFWYKIQSLMLGGAIAGVAGAFFAWQLSAIYPDNFQPQLTFDCWIMVILGGSGNNIGSLLGTVIFFTYNTLTREFLPRIFTQLSVEQLGAFRIMFIGLVLITMMVWRPQGILGKKEELTLDK